MQLFYFIRRIFRFMKAIHHLKNSRQPKTNQIYLWLIDEQRNRSEHTARNVHSKLRLRHQSNRQLSQLASKPAGTFMAKSDKNLGNK